MATGAWPGWDGQGADWPPTARQLATNRPPTAHQPPTNRPNRSYLINHTTPDQMRWITAIIMKEMKMGKSAEHMWVKPINI